MQGRISGIRVAATAGALLIAIAIAVRNFAPVPLAMRAEDWPAWVQAIGSVLAIAVAIWIPWEQRRDDVSAQREQRKLEAVLVAGEVSPLFAIYMRRINFFSQQLANSDQQDVLRTALPEETFDIFPGIVQAQPRFHLLNHTGVLANEVVGDLYILQMAIRILHRETLTDAAYRRMIENCDTMGRRMEALIRELDQVCPPRRDEILEAAATPKPKG